MDGQKTNGARGSDHRLYRVRHEAWLCGQPHEPDGNRHRRSNGGACAAWALFG